MAKIQTGIPLGMRYPRKPPQGEASGALRAVWYEIRCKVCQKVTRVGMKKLFECPACHVPILPGGYITLE